MKSTTTALVTVLVTLALGGAACGGSDSAGETTIDAAANSESTDAAAETETTEAAAVEESEEESSEQADEPETSAQSAVVTLSTGETFELTPTSCENQNTDPNDLLNDDFVDLSARNDDGIRFQVLNARAAGQEPAAVQVELSGMRDENGVNPKVSYIAAPGVIEATTLTIDGVRVTGESTIDARFSAEKPYGEEVVATFEFNC